MTNSWPGTEPGRSGVAAALAADLLGAVSCPVMNLAGWLRRAVGRPTRAESISSVQMGWFARFGMLTSLLAFAFDVGLIGLLHRDPRVDAGVLWTFAAINLPLLAALGGASLWLLRHPGRGQAVIVPAMFAPHVAVMVWVQVTGTLSSYFMIAGALLAGFHRAILTWRLGLLSVLWVVALHLGAFAMEEAGVLTRAALFVDGPGPVYGSAELRWSVMSSIVSVYGMTWAGLNVLVSALRETQGALASAERRLAEVTEGARPGRLTGRTLDGRWRLLEVIGRGGMGEVYRAIAETSREEVAIKVMHPHLADEPTLLARFRREADVASRVPATIAPALLDARLAGGDRYLVMEYLRGEDLAGLLRRRRRLPLTEAAALIDACAAVIGALHERGIVHRDLKPHNLFIIDSSVPSVRVLDFGIARGQEDVELTSHAQVVGTPGYIAPEHLAGGGAHLGPQADVYGLAVIAFQLVTGQRPFPVGDGSAAPAAPIAATSVDPGLPAGLDAVFALALAELPAERPPTALAFAAMFRQAIDGRLPDDAIRRAALLGPRSWAFEDTAAAAGLDLAGSTVRWKPG